MPLAEPPTDDPLDAATVSRTVRLPNRIDDAVCIVATAERRSVSNALRILVEEALKAREARLAETTPPEVTR